MPTETTRIVADRYRLLDSLGRGGMGVVWAAEDSILQRRVAIKEVETPRGLSDEERDALEARVMREARAAARLNHPHVVTVFDVVEDEGRTFIVMELVEAPTLTDVVAEGGPLETARAAQVALDVLSALEAAHAEGIVHRDVKPGNVMVPEAGNVKLGDFGIASVKGDPKITSTGLILGSPSYMAPEQATHGTSGPESDLWALGALLYFALEGSPPFDRGQALPTLAAVVGEPARPMEHGGELRGLIDALLSKEPADRPTADDVRLQLEAAARGHATQATTQRAVPPTRVETMDRPAPVPIPPRDATPASARPPIPELVAPRSASSKTPWIVSAAIVILALLAVWLLPNLLGDNETPQAEGQRNERANSGGGQGQGAAEENEGITDGGDAGQVDTSGWSSYTDEATGYTVQYPEGWTPSTVDETRTDFVDPASSTYLRVDWTDEPGDDPVAAWESFEGDFASSHEGYERITIEPMTFKDMEAAWWEFTYTDGGAQLHAVDLGFVTSDGTYGFALNFQTAEEDWAGSQDIFQAIQDSFQAPSS